MAARLVKAGYFVKVQWRKQPIKRGGISGASTIGQLTLWRFLEVQRLLKHLNIRHPEKSAKTRIVRRLRIYDESSVFDEAVADWYALSLSIRKSRDDFQIAAERILEFRRIGDENGTSELRMNEIEASRLRGAQNKL